MATVFEKLNLKNQTDLIVLNAPESFEPELNQLQNVNFNIRVERSLDEVPSPPFVLAFVTRQDQLDAISAQIAAKTEGDAIVWFAYPKGTSKKLKCDFNRDTGWTILKSSGFDTVRAIAIDQDWTAIRFRRIEFIKNSTRR
jgi:hypothetical protein